MEGQPTTAAALSADGSGGVAPDGMTPAEIAAQEQEDLWHKARIRPWHQRTWLRVVLVLATLTSIAALVPYPLRITAECTVIPSERAKVRSELRGVIAEILVDEGHAVKKGDVIARLDDRALNAERLKMVADIAKIEAELAVLRQGHRREEILQQEAIVAARRNEVEFAAKEAVRREQMAHDGVGSPQASEVASRDLETKRQAVAEAEAALRLLQAGSRPEEVAAHEAVLKGARAELAYVDEKLAMTLVRAPIDGEILTPRFREHVHEGVEAGGLVCEIANLRRLRAEIFVPERDVDAIELGMPVIVKVESYPTHRFEGKVDFIAPAVDGDDKRVRVVVELDNAEGLLKANMTGYGEIEASDHSLLHLAIRRSLRWIRVRYLL
jgi:putative peptide zinc metalloprotease protein